METPVQDALTRRSESARGGPLPIVFIGPSLPLETARTILDAEFRAPCQRGDVAAVPNGSVVAIIDGVFDQALSVCPREILQAIGRGVQLFGASSMGALRAAEVPGMHGVGRVFELYRSGAIDSDDEVALLFNPRTLTPMTVPLVNVRHAVDRLQRAGTISGAIASRMISAAKALHYTERTYERILEQAQLSDRTDTSDLVALLASFDLKRDDACLLLEYIARLPAVSGSDENGGTAARAPEGRPASGLTDHVASGPTLRAIDSRAPVFIWETGDRIPFRDLVEFLRLTNRLADHAHRAVTNLLLRNAFGSGAIGVESLALTKRQFQHQSNLWGWKTSEEVRVTLNDLGVSAKDVLRHLRGGAIMRGALASVLQRPTPAFLRALRCELLGADLGLKRETMVLASLRRLRTAGAVPPGAVEWARRLVCRLHGAPEWPALETTLIDGGVSPHRLRRFLHLLASAKVHVEPRLARRGGRDRACRDEADRRFGLSPTPKPSNEARFSISIDEAIGHAQRLRGVIGVTRTAMIGALGEIRGVHVSQAARPNGTWSSTYGSGKSDTREGAIVGGIMEETEKWTQEQFKGDQAWGTYEEVRRREAAVDPRHLDLPYDSIYTPGLPFAWQRCADLIRGESVLIPLALVACPFVAGRHNILQSARGARVTFSTNGLASGFTLSEALVHATCEYIERHTAKLAELRIDNPGVGRSESWPRCIRADSIDGRTGDLVKELLAAHYLVRVWDITGDIQVPTIFARLVRDGVYYAGWATHPDPSVACQAALFEACQTVIGLIAGGREDLTLQARSLGRHERPTPTRGKAATFWDVDDGHAVALEDVAGLRTPDIYAEFRWIREALVRAGVDRLLALDLSLPQIRPAHVVRVVIPGLETNNPFHCGLRARRVLAQDVLLC